MPGRYLVSAGIPVKYYCYYSAVSFLHQTTQNLDNAADRNDDKRCALALTPIG